MSVVFEPKLLPTLPHLPFISGIKPLMPFGTLDAEHRCGFSWSWRFNNTEAKSGWFVGMRCPYVCDPGAVPCDRDRVVGWGFRTGGGGARVPEHPTSTGWDSEFLFNCWVFDPQNVKEDWGCDFGVFGRRHGSWGPLLKTSEEITLKL